MVALWPPAAWQLEIDVAADTKGEDDGVEVDIDDDSADDESPLDFILLLPPWISFLQVWPWSLSWSVLLFAVELSLDQDSCDVKFSVSVTDLQCHQIEIHCINH